MLEDDVFEVVINDGSRIVFFVHHVDFVGSDGDENPTEPFSDDDDDPSEALKGDYQADHSANEPLEKDGV